MSTQPQANRIKIANPPLEDEVRTYLTTDCDAAATTLATLDNDGFVITGDDDYYIRIGEYGAEKTEIVLVDAGDAGTTNTGFKIGATKYSHEASDPVVFIKYNQVRFYGGLATGFTPVIASPLTTKDIDCSQLFTGYTYEGSTYSYFVTAYYNENDDEISAYSDEIENGSFTRRSVKRIIKSGLRKAMAQLDNTVDGELTWDTTLEILQDGIDEILARKRRWSFLKTISTSTTVASQAYISNPANLSMLLFVSIDNQQLLWMSTLDYNSYTEGGSVISTGNPSHYTLKNNKIYLFPTPSGVWDVDYEYYKVPATITSDLSTEVDLQFVPVLIYYCASQFSYIRGNDKRGDKMYKMYEKLLEDQVIEYSGPEQAGQAEYIERTSAYGGEGFIDDGFNSVIR